MPFKLYGRTYTLTREDVEQRLEGVESEEGRMHFVIVNSRPYPVKQALEIALNIPRDFKPTQARRVFRNLESQLIER